MQDHHYTITNPLILITYLDEKWFYTTNRRRNIRQLPLGKHTIVGEDFVIQSKMRSKRFPIKSMLSYVIARSCMHRNFNGRILLERVGEIQVIFLLAHTKFSDGVHTCEEIKSGKWKELFDSTCLLSPNEINSMIATNSCLYNFITDCFELIIFSCIGGTGNMKDTVLNGNSNIFEVTYRYDNKKRRTTIDCNDESANLKRQEIRWRYHKNNISCNSSYMLSTMDTVGKELWAKMHWVSRTGKVFDCG